MKLILKNVLMHMFQKKKVKNEMQMKKKYKKCGPVLRILTLKCKLCQAFSRYPKLNHG